MRGARRAFGQGGYLLLGGLVAGDLAHRGGHRHFSAVGRVLLAPVRRGQCGIAVRDDVVVDGGIGHVTAGGGVDCPG